MNNVTTNCNRFVLIISMNMYETSYLKESYRPIGPGVYIILYYNYVIFITCTCGHVTIIIK